VESEKLNQYVKDATRTESIINKSLNSGVNYRIMHANIGILTEVGEILDSVKKSIFYGKEYDFVNLQEEVGDIMWYLAIFCDESGIDLQQKFNLAYEKYQPIFKAIDPLQIIAPALRLNHLANSFAQESVGFCYDEEIHNDFEIFVSQLIEPISDIVCLSGSNIYDVAEQNIRKLKKRFPEKFTSERALNRNLEQEREELEK
jgi:hypothetical protein